MRNILSLFFIIQMAFISLVPATFSQCGIVADNLSLTLPCVEYEGVFFKLHLSAYDHPADHSSLYWRYESIQPVNSGNLTCAHADNVDLTITAPCVYYGGINISMTLEYYINPLDPKTPYWKFGPSFSLNPVEITSISGDTAELLYSQYSNPEFLTDLMEYMTCAAQCNQDVSCLMNCGMPDMGLGSSFSLVFELHNPEITPIEFILPAGTFFQPGASDVQPMLIAKETCLMVEPGYMKFLVPTYCMDGNASAPSAEDDFSVIGAGVFQKPCIDEILDLIKDKENITHANSYAIQDAIWNCMELGSITEEERIALQNL